MRIISFQLYQYHKIPKYADTPKIAVIILNLNNVALIIE